MGAEAHMPFRVHTSNLFHEPPSICVPDAGATDRNLTAEQDCRVRAMGEEELALLRTAASSDGLQLASLNWILASLISHGVVIITATSDRRVRAVATKAGHLALALRPTLPADSVH